MGAGNPRAMADLQRKCQLPDDPLEFCRLLACLSDILTPDECFVSRLKVSTILCQTLGLLCCWRQGTVYAAMLTWLPREGYDLVAIKPGLFLKAFLQTERGVGMSC